MILAKLQKKKIVIINYINNDITPTDQGSAIALSISFVILFRLIHKK